MSRGWVTPATGHPASRPPCRIARGIVPIPRPRSWILITAAVIEDLLEASEVRLLRDDGEAILDFPTLVYRRDGPTTRRVLHVIGIIALAGLVFLIVAGATEDVVLALLAASVVVVLLALSVYGPGWWERRGRPR